MGDRWKVYRWRLMRGRRLRFEFDAADTGTQNLGGWRNVENCYNML